jgi:glycosyltransferase involved in cell wall biosynthesis
VEIERSDKEIRILNVSDMVDSIKNISGLLHAFVKVSPKYPEARLYLVGGGPDEKMLQDLAKDLGISSKVKFFGRLANDKVLPMYKQVDFVIINSNVETFSVVAAEALMAGKPVLSTRCGGVEEFMNDQTGILIKTNDPLQLERALEKMITGYTNFDAQSLKTYAKEKFSSEAIGKSLSSIYHSIIS